MRGGLITKDDDQGRTEKAARMSGLFRRSGWDLVEDLEAELDDAGGEGAGDDAAGRGIGTVGAADGGGQVEIGVVEEVVELAAELYFETLDGGGELLVEGEVGLVEGGVAERVAGDVAEGALNDSADGGCGQREGGGVDVLDKAAGCDLGVLDGVDAGITIGSVEVGAAEAVGDGGRDLIGGAGGVGEVEGRAGLHGVDG